MPGPTRRIRKFGLLALFLIPCAFWAAWWRYARRPVHRLPEPRLVYWAWERPEDLRFLDARTESVAFLASSVELLPDVTRVYPRMQPLLLPPGIQVVAVVRVYSHTAAPASLDARQFDETLQTLLGATKEARVSALQIDFDARESERAFYAKLLRQLREQLGPSYPISMTALASWCIGDRWIRDLPVDEAVPMLFSMGKEEVSIRHYLGAVGRFPEPLCRGSLGISTGEPWPDIAGSRTRIYVFNASAWTPAAANEIRSKLHRGI